MATTAHQLADKHRPGTTRITDPRCFASDGQLARVTWTGPAAWEGTWGEQKIADAAQCQVELFLSQRGALYATLTVEAGSLTAHEYIGLDADGKHVTGYDGVMSLPPQVLIALEEAGYTYDEDLY